MARMSSRPCSHAKALHAALSRLCPVCLALRQSLPFLQTFSLGKLSAGADDMLAAVTDAQGNALVTGTTQSPRFPVANAFQYHAKSPASEGFVTRFGPSGKLQSSSLLGGNFSDECYGIATNEKGDAYMTGSTDSRTFPTVNAFQDTKAGPIFKTDAFVVRVRYPVVN